LAGTWSPAAAALAPGALGLGVGLVRRGTALAAAVLVAIGGAAGVAAGIRDDVAATAAVPSGRAVLAGRLLTDPMPGPEGSSFAFRPTHLRGPGGWHAWEGPRLGVAGEAALSPIGAGDRIRVEGVVTRSPGVFRGDPIAGWVRARRIERLGPPSDPLFFAASVVRGRIADGLREFAGRPASALMAGFLIGDVSALPAGDRDALQAAGLSHYVAVSGSNVALFLAGWWLIAGPLGWGPRRRAALGLVGVALFCVITRWEPSVVRASAMAAVALTGRLVGVPVSGWTALGTAVSGLLLVAPGLAVDPGFQLSAAATAGVLAGAGVFRGRHPNWAWTAVAATLSAQVAVAPLLLVRFGSLPLAAPLCNVVAAPLVAFSTVAGGIGVLVGIAPVTYAGLAAAEVVLAVARIGARLPMVGAGGLVVLVTLGALGRVRRLRPAATLAGAVVLAVAALPHDGLPAAPEVVFLDVGQGDAVLLRDPAGVVILVDGGPAPAVLRNALRRWGVRRVDLLVITHDHTDHVAGLAGITDVVRVGQVWHADQQGEVLAEVAAELRGAGVPLAVAEPGWRASVGAFSLEVMGPVRRYASSNDGSIVLWVAAGDRTLLLPGDVEALAQGDLGPLRADVMKVPHQGAATSDLRWLADSAPQVAVISVGPNRFGHPATEVVAVLQAAGAEVRRTDREGDVVVKLGP
jgi:competence protein ComEC